MSNATELRKKQEERVVALFGERTFKRIALNLLDTPSTGIDSDTNLKDIDEEIHEHGLISPISVCGPYSDGKYKVVEGARRIKALRRFLKSDNVPCYIVDQAMTDREVKKMALAANRVHREDDRSLNLAYAQMVFDDYADKKIGKREMTANLSELSGLDKRQARKYVGIITSGEAPVLDSVADNSLQINEAFAITKTYPSNKKMQDKMVNVCKAATTTQAKRDVIKEIREGRGKDLAKGNVKKNIATLAEKNRLLEKVETTEACLEAILKNPDFLPEEEFHCIRDLCERICAL